VKEDLDDAEWGESTSCKTRSGAVRSFSKSRLVRLLGGGVLTYTVWMATTLLGHQLGSAIDDPTRYGLDFAFTAAFLALLLGMWKGRADLLPWAVAALSAILAARLIEGSWYILIGGITGSLAGALADKVRHVD